jgi:hypothetical protein
MVEEIVCKCEHQDYNELLEALAGHLSAILNQTEAISVQTATLVDRADNVMAILLAVVAIAVGFGFCYIIFRLLMRFF